MLRSRGISMLNIPRKSDGYAYGARAKIAGVIKKHVKVGKRKVTEKP
jgi:hypothetical protein